MQLEARLKSVKCFAAAEPNQKPQRVLEGDTTSTYSLELDITTICYLNLDNTSTRFRELDTSSTCF